MPGALGPRFLIEAGFIIAVAVVAGVERFRTLTIVLVVGASWFVVAAVELTLELARRRARAQTRPARPAAPAEPPQPQVTVRPSPAVRVLRAEAPTVARRQEPEPPPEPVVTPGPSPEPEPETAPEEAPAPEPPRPVPEQPRVVAAAPPPPPPPAREPEPASAVVPLTPRRVEPREWNLWELERIVREQSGADVARDEERAFLLMYLREFASPDGLLPVDFDAVVRESFGEALDAIPR